MKEKTHADITILGLGPGDPNQLTLEASRWLEQIDEIFLRTSQHPVVAALPPALKIHSFDAVYEQSDRFEEVYERITQAVIKHGKRPQGVTYAVPGHPFVAEATCSEIIRCARQEGLSVRVIDGLSFLEPVCRALEIDPFPQLCLVDALELGASHHPSFPPSSPALVAQIYSRRVAAEVKLTLNAVYPDEHPVRLVHAAGTLEQLVEDMPLYEIDRSDRVGLLSVLYIPPLGRDTSFEAFQELVAHLRAEDGCPWDRKQTHLSLRQHLLEETYETLAALDAEDYQAMAEEFGDLLLQIVLHAQIASEEGTFTMADILRGIHQKIVRRHPHVFGDIRVSGVSGVLANWEKLKAKEREENGEKGKGLLDGVPRALPALSQAQEYQERAARVGFDWKDIHGPLDKIREEMEELQTAASEAERFSEIGDLLFALTNVIRWYGVDAESALRAANQRFYKRFSYIEKRAEEEGCTLSNMTLEEMDRWWDEAKTRGL
ncbi:MAG: nucleoside triphosphate pyrophosphohydrolase [Anaerolineae bacterium]|nr:nucleoside triphosphate pyrophosphohydrolase [Anaerolineae bacterium]